MIINKPIFIIGCGRSGTTILFNILSQHPALTKTTGYPDGEDHVSWIEHGGCAMAGIGNVDSSHYEAGINGYNYCLHMNESDATTTIITNMRKHYWNDVLEKNPDARVLTKQPHLSNKLRYVLKIFPDAKFIHIIRDCEPVVASWIAIMDTHPSLVAYWPAEKYPCFWLLPKPKNKTVLNALHRSERVFPGNGAAIWIDYWRQTNICIEEQLQDNLEQLCVVRYEDLISHNEKVLQSICRFCEIGELDQHDIELHTDTASKRKHLITPSLKQKISEDANAVRHYFGYDNERHQNTISSQLIDIEK